MTDNLPSTEARSGDIVVLPRPVLYIDPSGKPISQLEAAQQSVNPVDLVETLDEIRRSGCKDDHARVAAVAVLLDRVWPKPRQAAPLVVNNLNFTISVPPKRNGPRSDIPVVESK